MVMQNDRNPMREVGGYIEFEHNRGSLYHDGAIRLNCGRACLEYLVKVYGIQKIWLPLFLCDTVKRRCDDLGVETEWYRIDRDFTVMIPNRIGQDDWLYLVNYYGQLSGDDILRYKERHENIILDNAQAYYELPIPGVPTLYTCRKFLGVPDGAFLYSDHKLDAEPERDRSYDRMGFLLGRFEADASEFYDAYVKNNERFVDEPMKTMSALTENILRGIDHEYIRKARTENWRILHRHLSKYNRLKLKDTESAFAYPLWIENGREFRQKLIGQKIYIPLLWPNVLEDCEKDTTEYQLAENILPIPCDQRYSREDMDWLAEQVTGDIRNR